MIELFISSVGLGALYALLAIGVALLFGVLGLINFAYGEIILAAAFAMYLFQDLPLPVAAVIAVLFAVIVAVVSERLAFRPLRSADPITLMIASFAVSLALQSTARMSVLPRAKGVPPFEVLAQRIEIFGARVAVLDIVTLIVCGIGLLAVALLIDRTGLGVQLRAAAEDFRMARALGVKGNRVMASAFVLTGVLAGIGAVVLLSRQGSISAEMGLQPMLIGVIGAVLGGLTSLRGAALGGFLLGIGTALLEAVLPTNLVAFRDAFLFTGLIILLVIRPQGIIAGAKVRVS